MGICSWGLENEFETAIVNKSSVFKPLKFYCIMTPFSDAIWPIKHSYHGQRLYSEIATTSTAWYHSSKHTSTMTWFPIVSFR